MKFSLANLALATLAFAAPTPEAEAVAKALSSPDAKAAAAAGWPVPSFDFFNFGSKSAAVAVGNCSTGGGVHFLAVRGHGGKVVVNGKPIDDPNPWNVLSTTRDLLLQQIPGSTVMALPYDYNNPDEVGGTNTGGPLFKNYIYNYVKACPNTKIATLGYSQGALVVMDGFCGASEFPVIPTLPMDGKYAKNIIAAGLYGDESRVAGQPWNYGTCKGTGPFPRMNNYGCAPFAKAIRSYCDAPDNFCCLGGQDTGPTHAAYVKVYNQPFINFIKGRLNGTIP